MPAPTADYIVVEMAKHLLGENWMADYVAKANNGGIERPALRPSSVPSTLEGISPVQ